LAVAGAPKEPSVFTEFFNQGREDIARHVIDTCFEPSMLEL
jgi:hypothetical protein